MTKIPDVDLKALAAWKEQNRRERLEYVEFKVRWMRENGHIIDPAPKKP